MVYAHGHGHNILWVMSFQILKISIFADPGAEATAKKQPPKIHIKNTVQSFNFSANLRFI